MKNTFAQKLKAFAYCCTLILFSFNGFAQVGIGTTNPNANAKLDIVSTVAEPGGLLLPRVALTATDNFAPLTAHVAGMTVYNTATTTGVNMVTPGYYYNDGGQWVRIAAASVPSSDWTVFGNTGTVPGTSSGQNYLGTTDNQNLIVATNGSERLRVLANGQVVVNNTAPFAGSSFSSFSLETNHSVTSRANFGYALYGEALGGSGKGVVAINPNATGVGLIAAGGGAGLSSLPGTAATFNGGGIGASSFTSNAVGTGLSGVGNASNTSRTLIDGAGVAGSGDTGVYGISTSANGIGLMGIGNFNDSNIASPPNGAGIAGSGTRLGVFGYAGNGYVDDANRGNAAGRFTLDADNDVTTNSGHNGNRATAILAGFDNVGPGFSGGQGGGGTGTGNLAQRDSYYGGYFSGGSESNGTPSYAYVGMRYKTNVNGNGFATSGAGTGRDYKIIGTGVVSTLINDVNGTPRVLFAPEAPEVVFQDYGIGQLVNGEARILMDPVFKRGIHVDADSPLKVYVTLEGDCNGIYVTDKSEDGFTVKELKGGTSSVPFSWQIVATRADTKNAAGEIVSKYVGVRLPEGPSALSVKAKKLEEVTLNNETIPVLQVNSSTLKNVKEISEIDAANITQGSSSTIKPSVKSSQEPHSSEEAN
ncbi:MAG: hypothetical protein WBA61_01330 [Aequorivita sp.]